MRDIRSICTGNGWATRLPAAPRRHTTRHLLLLLVFTLLTLAITWPVPSQLSTHLMGEDFDVWNRPWNTWWTRKALTEGRDFYFTDFVFFPQGTSLIYHSFSHTNTALSLLLEPLVGVATAYNIPGLLAYILSGFAMYLLVVELTGDWVAGLIAGIIFTFAPYHVDQSSHPIAYTTQWIPLTMLFLIRMVRRRSVWDGFLAALFLALTALSSWHLFLFTSLLVALFVGYSAVSSRRSWDRQTWRNTAIFGVVALILVGPFLYPLIREQFVATDPDYMRTSATGGNVADLLLFVVPSRRHPLWGDWVRPIHDQVGAGSRQIFLGYAALLLGAYGLTRRSRVVTFWGLAALFFFVLSLGPYPTLKGQRIGLLLPWGLPISSVVRDTQRFVLMVNLAIAVLAGLGMAALRKQKIAHRRILLSGASVTIVLLEFLTFPFPSIEIKVSEFYRQIANDPDPGAIVDLPLGKLTLERLYMFYQIIHQKPIVEGIVGRKSTDAYEFINNSPLLTALHSGKEQDLSELGDLSRQLEALHEEGFRYILIHRREVSPEQVAAWQTYLAVPPVYTDDQLIAYRVDPQPGRDYDVSQPLAGNLGVVRWTVAPLVGPAAEKRTATVLWTATDRPEAAYQVEVQLVDTAGQVVRRWTEPLWSGWPTAEWEAGTLVNNHYSLDTGGLPAGMYQVAAVITDQATGAGVDVADLGGLLVTSPQGGAPTRVAEATLGESFSLTGYDLIQNRAHLLLSPYWSVQEPIDRDYKFFVHLIDAATGAMAAQYDAVPHDWGYPTSAWETGQVVADLMIVPLEQVPPGQYSLVIGAYDLATGERLPAAGSDAWMAGEGQIKLPEVVVVPAPVSD